MIDKAKTIESLLDALESLNQGETKEKNFVLVLSNGERIKQPLLTKKIGKRAVLKLIKTEEEAGQD